MSLSTERIRGLHSSAVCWDVESPYRDQFAAEFDAWLLSHDAEIRADQARRHMKVVSKNLHDAQGVSCPDGQGDEGRCSTCYYWSPLLAELEGAS